MSQLKHSDIRAHGQLVEVYPVDESQTVSNAGDAEVYDYQGKLYEVVTWNEAAEEHERGSVSVSVLER